MPRCVVERKQPAEICRMAFEGFRIHVEEDFGFAAVVDAPLVDVVGVLHGEGLAWLLGVVFVEMRKGVCWVVNWGERNTRLRRPLCRPFWGCERACVCHVRCMRIDLVDRV